MADASVVNLYSNFMRFWWSNFDVFDGEVFACFPGHRGLLPINWGPYGLAHKAFYLASDRLRRKDSVKVAGNGRMGLLTFPTVSPAIPPNTLDILLKNLAIVDEVKKRSHERKSLTCRSFTDIVKNYKIFQ